uniref:Receptor expression-enhancing protein n=1 Tax=Parastrongyloides trichosuri TaxID=131310 RepID=A0A0N4ZF77_PARTI
MKNCTIKLKNFFYYWLFAGWWPSVAGYLDSHIGQPVKDRYNKLIEKVKYFIYGYWISPMGQKLKEILKDSALILLVFSKKMGIKIGILLKDTVIWPVLLWCYDIAIIPAYEVIKDKYRYVEDNVLIYFLAPVCQTVINVVPEKSPFVEDSDIELDDFLPSENDADSDASWDPYEDEKKRKEMEAALVAKKEKVKEKLAQIDLPDFNDLGSSDEEFMFDN